MTNMDSSQSGYAGFGPHLIQLMDHYHLSRAGLSKLTQDSPTGYIGDSRLKSIIEGAEPREFEVRTLDGVFNTLPPSPYNQMNFYRMAGKRLPETSHRTQSAAAEIRNPPPQTGQTDPTYRRVPSFEERVGQVLLEGGFVTGQQLDQAYENSRESGIGLLDTLVSYGTVAQETLVTVLSFQLRIPVVDLRHVEIDQGAVDLLTGDFARQYEICPIGYDADGSLRVATRMPNDFQLEAEISTKTGRKTKFVLAIGGKLEDLIDKIYK